MLYNQLLIFAPHDFYLDHLAKTFEELKRLF